MIPSRGARSGDGNQLATMRVCKDCGEALSFYAPESLWLPRLIDGMGRSCRIRYGKLCDPDPPYEKKPVPPVSDPYKSEGPLRYPETFVA